MQSLRLIDAKEEPLGQEILVNGLNATPGAYVRIRAQVTGSNPTTITIRAWADGSSEPTDWVSTATDSTPVLQGAGTVGVRAYLAAKTPNAPVVVSVDDFVAK